MNSTYRTWVDQYPSYHHNFPVRSFLQSSIGLPKLTVTENAESHTFNVKIEVEHDGRHFELSDNFYVASHERDPDYYHRSVRQLADRLLVMIINDETERWLDLTP